MDFALNELQLEIKSLAGQVLRDHCLPERLLSLERTGYRLDTELWSQLVEAGLTAIPVAESAGGAGLGFLEACLLFEQLGATVAPVPLMGHTLAAMVIERALGAEVLASLLTASSWLACSTRTEGNQLEIKAGKLHGQLGGIAYGQGSQQIVLPAREDGQWVLCRLNTENPGLRWQAQTSTGLEPQAQLQVSGVAVDVLGGPDLLSWLEQRMVVALSMAQTGVLDEAVQLAKQHVSEREQFGVKIGSFQAVAHRMADCWIDLMNLRLASLSAAAALDYQTEAALEVRTAQVWSAEAGHRVLASCQHVHGGLGHDRDYPLWRYAVWARQYEMSAGGLGSALEQLGAAIAVNPEAAFL